MEKSVSEVKVTPETDHKKPEDKAPEKEKSTKKSPIEEPEP